MSQKNVLFPQVEGDPYNSRNTYLRSLKGLGQAYIGKSATSFDRSQAKMDNLLRRQAIVGMKNLEPILMESLSNHTSARKRGRTIDDEPYSISGSHSQEHFSPDRMIQEILSNQKSSLLEAKERARLGSQKVENESKTLSDELMGMQSDINQLLGEGGFKKNSEQLKIHDNRMFFLIKKIKEAEKVAAKTERQAKFQRELKLRNFIQELERLKLEELRNQSLSELQQRTKMDRLTRESQLTYAKQSVLEQNHQKRVQHANEKRNQYAQHYHEAVQVNKQREQTYWSVRDQFLRVQEQKKQRIDRIKQEAMTRVMETVREEDEATSYVREKIAEREIAELMHLDQLKKTQQRIKNFEYEVQSLKKNSKTIRKLSNRSRDNADLF